MPRQHQSPARGLRRHRLGLPLHPADQRPDLLQQLPGRPQRLRRPADRDLLLQRRESLRELVLFCLDLRNRLGLFQSCECSG